METRTLSNFIVVAEEKSLRRAAARLHMTQPALSRQIQALEEEIGVPLFVRNTSGMEITAAGESLLHHARNIKTEIELAKRNAFLTSHAKRQKLDIGVGSSTVFNIAPEILERFSRLHPNVDLVLHTASEEEHVESLRHGRILIAFSRGVRKPAGQDVADIVSEEVLSEPMLIALHKDHPLAGRTHIGISDLRNELLIGGPDPSYDQLCLQQWGFMPRVEKRSTDLMNALSLVGCGYGICAAPASMQDLKIRNVVYKPFLEGERFPFRVRCLYSKQEKSLWLPVLLQVIHAYREETAAAAAQAMERCAVSTAPG